jgi:hypothetical protein
MLDKFSTNQDFANEYIDNLEGNKNMHEIKNIEMILLCSVQWQWKNVNMTYIVLREYGQVYDSYGA